MIKNGMGVASGQGWGRHVCKRAGGVLGADKTVLAQREVVMTQSAHVFKFLERYTESYFLAFSLKK